MSKLGLDPLHAMICVRRSGRLESQESSLGIDRPANSNKTSHTECVPEKLIYMSVCVCVCVCVVDIFCALMSSVRTLSQNEATKQTQQSVE